VSGHLRESGSKVRYKGKVTGWKDEQGYGFVAPSEGGKPIFLHISAFTRRSRRPVDNDLVTYRLGTDDKKRARAIEVRFSKEKAVPAAPRRTRKGFPVALAVGFVLFLAAATVRRKVPEIVCAVYLGMSLITFVAYYLDKSAARNNDQRISENTLQMLSLLGGWPGAAFAQRLLRHKTSKTEFQRAFWAAVIVNCAALVWILSRWH